MLRFSVGCLAKWWHFLGRSETWKVFPVWQLMTQLMTFWYLLIMPTGPFQTRTFGSSKPRNENIIHLAVDEPVAPSVLGINWNLRYHIWCQEHLQLCLPMGYGWSPCGIFHVKSMMICQFIMSSLWVHYKFIVSSLDLSRRQNRGKFLSVSGVDPRSQGWDAMGAGCTWFVTTKVDSGRYSIPHRYFLWIFLWVFLWVYGWSKTS